jgi:asparagine synthase (glutamine-hydrolysing)
VLGRSVAAPSPLGHSEPGKEVAPVPIPAGPGPDDPWFVALPDSDAAGPVAADVAARWQPRQRVDHPSGRPWVLGCWPDDAALTARAGTTALVVLGQHAGQDRLLAEQADRVRGVAELDRLAGSLVGSVHLLASVAGTVRVQGSVTGIRRVFSADAGAVPVAADRADVLAALTGAGLDERRLALHLLHPHVLYPVAGLPVWRGVDVLDGDAYLRLDATGRRPVRWWRPPDPVLPLAEGAAALRTALTAAVDARVDGRELVSCDLGGLDSTAVCSLAARHRTTVVAYTAASWDPLADDVTWAERTVAGLDGVEHQIIPADEMPLVFGGMTDVVDRFDEPCSATIDGARWLTIARRAADRGSPVHLTGFGGDELLYGSVAHLHDLLRTSPRVAVRALRGFTAKYRWPRRAVLRQLAGTAPYGQWLAGVADTVTAPRPGPSEPLLAWGFAARMPPWATPDAVAAVRDEIRAAAAAVAPLSDRRGQQRELETMRYLSRMSRQLDQRAGRYGIALAAPYYDDRVIEAGLAVRPEDRVTPWRYKPLIVEAMRGVVPAASLGRDTKANGSGDEEPGLRRHRGEMLALWDDSRLGALGLVDAAAVRDACAGALPPDLQFGVLDQLVACEAWLRSLDSVTTPA